MAEFKKIYELEVVDKVEDTDLFIVETAHGTRATKINLQGVRFCNQFSRTKCA